MRSRKINNKGVYNENPSISGGEMYNAARDINVYQDKAVYSLQEFQNLLSQINSEVKKVNLPKSEQQDIEAIVAQVLKQSQKKEPKKSLIVGPLTTAFELIVQAAGAATAAATIAQLLQKAITFAQSLF